jgi:hypothetical protein
VFFGVLRSLEPHKNQHKITVPLLLAPKPKEIPIFISAKGEPTNQSKNYFVCINFRSRKIGEMMPFVSLRPRFCGTREKKRDPEPALPWRYLILKADYSAPVCVTHAQLCDSFIQRIKFHRCVVPTFRAVGFLDSIRMAVQL